MASLCGKPSRDIEKKADVALRWIERAAFSTDPLISLLYQFFALEALLGDVSQGLKSAQLAFRSAMLSLVATGEFRHPSTTLMLYEDVRNYAVHGQSMPDVDRTTVRAFAAEVREALCEYLALARARGFSTRGKLTAFLDCHPKGADLVEWIRHYGGDGWEQFLAKRAGRATDEPWAAPGTSEAGSQGSIHEAPNRP
ncbi:hypothetical protein [Amycolatopsis camponoti]|uniref:hypothetical protein n=1 Tax=Amycolatopsis camponoti TaxID=2606593 RepID=UPI0012D7DC0B|nr:hypothetical protein [Amycolatopsis camponoti]